LEDRLAPALLTVTDGGDAAADPQSLRWAIGHAQPGDVIDFSPAVRSVSLTAGLTIGTSLRINNDQGSGPVTIDGGGAVRPFLVTPGVTAYLSGLTITHGSAPAFGGGIQNQGPLTLTGCTLSGNSTGYAGSGIDNDGTLTLTNCTLSGNPTQHLGGDDDAIDNQGTLMLAGCTLSGNSAYAGGGIRNSGKLTLTSCTLSGNSADYDGGGILNDGGSVLLDNSIVAGNFRGPPGSTGGPADDIWGTVDPSSSYNLIGTGGSGGLTNGVNHNLVGVSNPGLAPLAANGGPTQTMALLAPNGFSGPGG
jgi:hypothetical protein